MSNVIVDFAAKRQSVSSSMSLEHPAGVTLPIDGSADAELITPEIRDDIRSGAYSADLVRQLPDAVMPGDRVLVIGAGLGVVSTLVARSAGVDRVIAAEANTTLIPYLNRVHEVNGVAEVETINTVLAAGEKGRIPFFARRDLRDSSLLPHDQAWEQAMMVPFMDIDLILAEEQISLIVCDIPADAAELLAQADLSQVDRIVLDLGDDAARCWEESGVCTQLVAQGYSPEKSGTTMILRRSSRTQRIGSPRAATPANLNSAPLVANLRRV